MIKMFRNWIYDLKNLFEFIQYFKQHTGPLFMRDTPPNNFSNSFKNFIINSNFTKTIDFIIKTFFVKKIIYIQLIESKILFIKNQL